MREAEAELGAHARAGQGIANLRTVLDLLDAAGVPAGPARDRPGPGPRARLLHRRRLRDHGQRLGEVRQRRSGGRYDNLASLFTVARLPGVGASIGLDRLLALLDEAGWLKSTAHDRAGARRQLPRHRPGDRRSAWPPELRAAGIGAEVYPDPIQIGKQMGYGSTRGHKLAVIVGPDEAAKQVFNLRDLATRQEDKGLPWSVLEDSVESRAGDHRAGRDRLMNRPIADRDQQPIRSRWSGPIGAGARHARLAARANSRGWPGWSGACSTVSRGPVIEPMRTPILESTELHERKSGAGIVSKLFELAGGAGHGGESAFGPS